MCPERGDEPVANPGCEGGALAADLVGEDLAHVRPGHGPEGEGKEDRDGEEERHTGDAVPFLVPVLVLAVYRAFAYEGDGDGDDAKDERLLSANLVDNEEDEDQVCLCISTG